jgi:hypothetical protein
MQEDALNALLTGISFNHINQLLGCSDKWKKSFHA